MALQALDGVRTAGRSAGLEEASSPRTRRQDEMRRHLAAAAPSSGNEALRLLRAAFPQTSLSERVEAASSITRFMV